MGPPASDHDIILFCYDISVFSRRIEYYLGLRGIKYSRCIQPPNLPRPDLAALGINYRRIPILAIGKDVYMDTRIMIEKLEELYPHNTLGSKEPFNKGIEKIIESWVIEAGPFWKAAAAIPLNAPIVSDPVWMEDRRQGSGGHFTKDTLKAGRPAAHADLISYFTLAEQGLLADGRKFLFNTDEPTLADVHGIWSFDWTLHMAMGGGDENAGEGILTQSRFPKVTAWVDRFRRAYEKAVQTHGKAEIVPSEEAKKRILASDFTEPEGEIDERDPLNLKKGQAVEIRAVDFGFTHADTGKLVSLDPRETVIAIKVKEGDAVLRLHYPRTGFKITPVDEAVANPSL